MDRRDTTTTADDVTPVDDNARRISTVETLIVWAEELDDADALPLLHAELRMLRSRRVRPATTAGGDQ